MKLNKLTISEIENKVIENLYKNGKLINANILLKLSVSINNARRYNEEVKEDTDFIDIDEEMEYILYVYMNGSYRKKRLEINRDIYNLIVSLKDKGLLLEGNMLACLEPSLIAYYIESELLEYEINQFIDKDILNDTLDIGGGQASLEKAIEKVTLGGIIDNYKLLKNCRFLKETDRYFIIL